MELYFYDRKDCHKRQDTDKMIKESLNNYISANSLSPFCGEILRTDLGKPYIDYPLHIGVTHTDTVVIIAIDKVPLGIDCEEKDRIIKRRQAIQKRFFCENETSLIEKSRQKDKAFLEVWVKKEAYVKFTGQGISGLQDCDTTVLSGFKKIPNHKNLIIYIYKENNHE